MHENLGIWSDPADAHEASYERHPVEDIEPEIDTRSVGWLEKVLQILQGHERCYIVDCLMLCMPSGVAYMQGMNMTEVAKYYGVTKSAVSKKCRQIRIELGLPQSNFMREEHETFRITNLPRVKGL